MVTVEYSTATEAELQGGGHRLPGLGAAVLGAARPRLPDRRRSSSRIHDLALEIVPTRTRTNPYDEGDGDRDLPARPEQLHVHADAKTPDGVDPIDYFLFTSNKGYCEFFATAMGDMLRSPGHPDPAGQRLRPGHVRRADQPVRRARRGRAHVGRVYFPGYGWIPFEPTTDNLSVYSSIPRGAGPQATCLSDNNCRTRPAAASPIPVGADSDARRQPRRAQRPRRRPLIGGFSVSSLMPTPTR